MLNKYKPIKQTKTSDLIVREIWNLILKGDLKPGDKLPPERELGKRLLAGRVAEKLGERQRQNDGAKI